MLRGVRTAILASRHDLIREPAEHRAHSVGSESAISEFRAHQFEHQALRKAFQINLRSFALHRGVMIHGGKEHAHSVAAGAFHGGVNGAGSVFRREAASDFHRRSKTANEAESFADFANLWRANGRVDGIVGRISAISDESSN